jgi:hypothetical protein
LIEAERLDSLEVVDRAPLLERKRRANNIVFYGARLIERQGRRALDKLELPHPLSHFVRSLVPDYDIEGADNVSVLHTVGCYFSAVGRSADLHRVARRIFELMLTQGQQMEGEDAEACSQEVFEWFLAAQQAQVAAMTGVAPEL